MKESNSGSRPFGGQEGLSLEFKKAHDTLPRSVFETVCAFLNLDGGLLVLGVADDGTVTGIDSAALERIRAEIANLSKNVSKYLPIYSGGATPKFDEQADMFVTTIPLAPETAKHAGDLGISHVTPEVTPEVERLLPLCATPQTRRELQDALGLKDDDHFRVAYILPAMNGGYVEMTLPDKPQSRNQKYQLTEKGSDALKALGAKHTTIENRT